MKIEVLGPGCMRCRKTEANVKAALQELGIEADVVHVTDVTVMAQKGVMMTPAVIIDGELKCQGRIPEVAEAKTWLSG